MLQIMEKRGQMVKSWGHSANNDVATIRIMEAGRSDDHLKELIEKEGEQKQENERGAVPVEELKGDRTVVFLSHTWEPRADTGIKLYQGLTEPEILRRVAASKFVVEADCVILENHVVERIIQRRR